MGQYQPLLRLWRLHRHPLQIALRQVIPRLAVQPEADVLPVLLQLHVSVLARRVGHLVHAIVGHGVLIAEEDVLHAVLPEAGDVGGDGGAGSGALNKHHIPRGEIRSGVGGLYAAEHGDDAALRDPRRVQPPDGDPAGKEAAHHHAAGQGLGGVLLCRGRDVIIVVVRLGRGGGGVVVAHPLHHGAVRVQTGQSSSRHLVFLVRKVLCGYFAVLSADGRGLGVQHLAPPRLGRHLGVAADDDVIGVAGRCILVYLRLLRTYTVADAGRSCAAHSLDGAAPDGDAAASTPDASADACAVVAALSGEGAVLAVVVLDGQGALRLMFVLLEACIAAAALQLVVTVQLDGGIVVALHGDGGFARIDWAVIAAIPLLLAADVNFQVVEGDVHFAAGGVDGDGVLLRLAGDDGLPLILLEILVALLDFVIVSAFIARTFDRDVAVGDVPPGRIGRDAGAHHDACDDGGGHAPPECALQSHSLSSFGLFVVREPVFSDTNLPKNREDVNKICANRGVFGVNSPLRR